MAATRNTTRNPIPLLNLLKVGKKILEEVSNDKERLTEALNYFKTKLEEDPTESSPNYATNVKAYLDVLSLVSKSSLDRTKILTELSKRSEAFSNPTSGKAVKGGSEGNFNSLLDQFGNS